MITFLKQILESIKYVLNMVCLLNILKLPLVNPSKIFFILNGNVYIKITCIKISKLHVQFFSFLTCSLCVTDIILSNNAIQYLSKINVKIFHYEDTELSTLFLL